MIATFIFLIKKHCNKETPSQANKSLSFACKGVFGSYEYLKFISAFYHYC